VLAVRDQGRTGEAEFHARESGSETLPPLSLSRGKGRRYTLRSSNDPRGRLRGGAIGEAGDAVAAAFGGGGGVMGAAVGSVGDTRACCTFAGRPTRPWSVPGVGAAAGADWPEGAVACAIPINVPGDNMVQSLRRKE
jgi:hypothetical protein